MNTNADGVIRTAIAGQGRSGYDIHLNYLKTDPRFKIVAVADPQPDQCGDAVGETGCQAYGTVDEMIARGGFDLFVNATPSRFHVDVAIQALRAGFHVLGEKPSAPTVAKFDEIVAAAERAGRRYFAFQNSRYYPYFVKIREVIASGVLGRILCIRINWSGFARRWDWQTRQDEQAGNLWNTGPHPVDQAIVLFGPGTPKVFCRMEAEHFDIGGDANNFCALTLYGDNAPTIEIQVSSFLAYPQGEQYSVQGTLGGLTGGPAGVKWKHYRPEEAPVRKRQPGWSQDRKYCVESLPWIEESWNRTEADVDKSSFFGLCRGLYGNLYDVLLRGAECDIKMDEVRRQIHAMEEAHRQNPLPPRPTAAIG